MIPAVRSALAFACGIIFMFLVCVSWVKFRWLAQHENYEVKYYQCQQEQASLLAKQIADQLDAVGRL